MKRIAYDPSFWLLLAFNSYCIIYYQQNHDRFSDIVWLYWGQSVLIGVFNFLDLLTIRTVVPGSLTLNDMPISNTAGKGCAAVFFLIHYQFFHLVYLFFIAGSKFKSTDFSFVLIGLVAVSFELIVNFIRNKIRQRHEAVNMGKMFFLPYLRIIPMHLMILLPAFLGWGSSVIFLVLKTVADLAMYLLTSRVRTITSG